MVSSVSSVALVPAGALAARPVAIRPADAGLAPAFDADALRRDATLRAETLDQSSQESNRSAGDRQAGAEPAAGRTASTSNAAFVTQLLAQDQPAERRRSPFAEAALAYGRFREEPKAGFILDPPRRVDVKV